MDLQFSKSVCQCLRKATCQAVNQEQTQEIRLPDTMPDIGRVLGSWGQVIVRGKEWRGNGMSVNGGVMVWVLYAPEDGSAFQCIEGWIPLQLKWDFPQTQRDGAICVSPLLKAVDARSVSARKIMVRASVSVMGEAQEPMEQDIYTPMEVPKDVQLLRRKYPVELPMEAGEMSFQMEEELTMPASAPRIQKLVRCNLVPAVAEQKVLAGRLVFRGNAQLQVVYLDPEGNLCTWSWELPFSQFTELDRDYSVNAASQIIPIVTGMEMEVTEDAKRSCKLGLSMQYTIFDRQILDLVCDGYSTQRQLQMEKEQLRLPVRLDRHIEDLQLRQNWDLQGQKIEDVVWYAEQPHGTQEDGKQLWQIPGQFQILYRDDLGQLQGATVRGEMNADMDNDPSNRVDVWPGFTAAEGMFMADGGQLIANGNMACDVFGEEGLTMVTALQLGEQVPLDPQRPSLILRRSGDSDLWDIAKECGSTVEAICKANAITGQPEEDTMLLIPVI